MLRIVGYVGPALLCLAIGVFLLVLGATADPALNVPPVVAFVAALAFMIAAFRLLQLYWQRDSAGNGSAALICIAFAVIGGWIAVGPGERLCRAGVMGAGGSAEGLGCRVPFGVGALLSAGLALYAALRWLRASRARHLDDNDTSPRPPHR